MDGDTLRVLCRTVVPAPLIGSGARSKYLPTHGI